MTLSTGSIISQADEVYGFDNLAPLIGTWRNLFWDQVGSVALIWGRQFGKFNFDFVRTNLKFSNLTPTIPETAVIVSAILRGTAQATPTGTDFFSVVRTLSDDGIWSPPSTSGWKTASTVNGPHGTLRTAADVAVLNIGAATLVETLVNTSHYWAIRDNADGRGLRAGQGVTIVTGGTLGFVDITLNRTGTGGAGNIWCEIYSQDGNGLAATLLATSNTRPASDAPGTPGVLRFTFSGGAQIIVAASQNIVVVLNGDYPLSGTDNVGMGWTRGGYSIGTFQLDGTGEAFDEQNYPMQRNFQNITGTGFVIWIAPKFFVGVDYDTPDLKDILQAHILTSGYAQGDPLAFAVERSLFQNPASTADRRWASFTHETFQPVRLIVEWKDRANRVSGTATLFDANPFDARIVGAKAITAAIVGALEAAAELATCALVTCGDARITDAQPRSGAAIVDGLPGFALVGDMGQELVIVDGQPGDAEMTNVTTRGDAVITDAGSDVVIVTKNPIDATLEDT